MEISFRETLALVKSVVLSPEVIGTAVVILLFLNMVFYVVSSKGRQNRKRKGMRSRGRRNARAGNVSVAASSTESADSSQPAV